MDKQDVIVRFDNVTFKYSDKNVILDNANFSIRKNSKITIMGQNGAGKSTIFKLLTGVCKPTSGSIHIDLNAKIAIAKQMITINELNLSILEYFSEAIPEKKHGIERNIRDVLRVVNLEIPGNKLDLKVSELSGGQKARLLLAYALIQEPDILLLDEPTNNLDKAGVEHLTEFLYNYPKTCIVISHDADFLNVFSDGVLNLDVFTNKVEQFVGNYYDVLDQIEAKIERDRLLNSRLEKSIKDRFIKVNKLGGKSVAMNRLANKVRADIEEDKEKLVDVRKEDKTIPDFTIPNQNYPGRLLKIEKVSFMKGSEIAEKKVNIQIYKGSRVIISGPNGIGKSTLLKSILGNNGAEISDGVRVGYYSQNFSELDFDSTAFDSLKSVMLGNNYQDIYNVAARFLLPGEKLQQKVGDLSEGQKGLLCYARFMLQEPGLLIMDEPTNHINFRHIPVIAKALDNFKGGLLLISHLPDFVSKIHINEELDLTKL
jgi:ATP-binding cassette subfamily F protein 3